MKTIFAYTDGSAVVAGKHKGKGGFGTYFPDLNGEKKAFSLGFHKGKTGQMEVMALLYAIKAMSIDSAEPIKLIVYSDSEYVVKTFTENRLKRWIADGRLNQGGSAANKELWNEIIRVLDKRKHYLTLEMRHIKGHQVDREKDPVRKNKLMNDPHIFGNMVADRLADYKRHKNLL